MSDERREVPEHIQKMHRDLLATEAKRELLDATLLGQEFDWGREALIKAASEGQKFGEVDFDVLQEMLSEKQVACVVVLALEHFVGHIVRKMRERRLAEACDEVELTTDDL